MSRQPSDLRALGARHLSSRVLVRQLLGAHLNDAEVDEAVGILALHHRARESALLELRHGPRLLAAVELGRRAWMSTPPVGARVAGPTAVAAVAAPFLVDTAQMLVIALDPRGRVARLRKVGYDGGNGDNGDNDSRTSVAREILLAGCRRGVVAVRVPRPAVPSAEDVETAVGVRARGELVGIDVVDWVLLGDDGFCSLLRLGLFGAATDHRYR